MRGTPPGKPARGVVRRAAAVWYRVMADCGAAGVHGATHGHAALAWGVDRGYGRQDGRGSAPRKLHSMRVEGCRQAGSVGGPSNQSLERPSGSVVAARALVVLRPSGGCGALVVGLPDAAQL